MFVANNKMVSSNPIVKSFLCCLLGLQTIFSPQLYADPLVIVDGSVISGSVVGGSGSIGYVDVNDAQNVDVIISQGTNSDHLAIDWTNFDIAEGQTVTFDQTPQQIVLNRIIGSDTGTIISGNINAPGTVFILNEKGIVFSGTATLDVHNLVAAGLTVNNDDIPTFVNDGIVTLSGGSGSVINQGLIQASLGGSVNLIGHIVRNEGIGVDKGIQLAEGTFSENTPGQSGQVNMIATSRASISFGADGLIGIEIGTEDLVALASGQALVSNSGNILADGGVVLLSASNGSQLFDNAVNNTGIISAQSIVNSNGRITLSGSGDISSTGDLQGIVDINTLSSGDILVEMEEGFTSGDIQAIGGGVDLSASDFDIQQSIQAERISLTQNIADDCSINCQLTLAADNSVISNTELSRLNAKNWFFNTADSQNIILEGDINQSGLQLDIQGPLEISGSRILNVDGGEVGALNISGTIDGIDNSTTNTLSTTGAVTLSGDVGTKNSKLLSDLTFNSDVKITDLHILASEVTFNQTLDSLDSLNGGSQLAVTGNLSLNGATGSVDALKSISVSHSMSIKTDTVITEGEQTYSQLNLLNSSSLTGENISIQNIATTNQFGLSINGQLELVGSDTALEHLNVSDTATLSGNISTLNNQQYGEVVLKNSLELGGKNISVGSITADDNQSLTIRAGEFVEVSNIGTKEARIGDLILDSDQINLQGNTYVNSLDLQSQSLILGDLLPITNIDSQENILIDASVQLDTNVEFVSQEANIDITKDILSSSGVEGLALTAENGIITTQAAITVGSVDANAKGLNLASVVDTRTGSGVIKLSSDGNLIIKDSLLGSQITLSSNGGTVTQVKGSEIVAATAAVGGNASSGSENSVIIDISAAGDVNLASLSAEAGEIQLVSQKSVRNSTAESASLNANIVNVSAKSTIINMNIDGQIINLNAPQSINVQLSEGSTLINTGFNQSLSDIASEVSGSQRQVESDLGDIDPAIFTELSIYNIDEDGIKLPEEDEFY